MARKILTPATRSTRLAAGSATLAKRLPVVPKIVLKRNPKKNDVCDPAAASLGYKYAVISKSDKCIGYYSDYKGATTAAKKHNGRIVYLHGGAMSEDLNQIAVPQGKFKLLQNPFKPSDLKTTPFSPIERVRESFSPGVKKEPYIKGSDLVTGGWVTKLKPDGTPVRNRYGDPEQINLIDTTWPIPEEIVIPAPPGKSYMPFQRAGIVAMSRRQNSFLADEPGLGKTIQIAGFINLNEPKKTVILCPGNATYNWENELYQWLVNKKTEILVFEKAKGFTKKSSTGKRIRLGEGDPDYDILIIPITNFQSKYIAESLTRMLRKTRPELLVIDEAHILKNENSKRTIAILGGKYDAETGIRQEGIVNIFSRKIFLTGTPLVNQKVAEIFHLLKALDPKAFGSKSIFEDQFYPVQGRRADGTPERETDRHGRNLDILGVKLRDRVMIRRLRKDVLDLQPPSMIPVILPNTEAINAARRLEKQKIREWIEATGQDPDKYDVSTLFEDVYLTREQLAEMESGGEDEENIDELVKGVRLSKEDRKKFNDIREEIENLQDILNNPDLSEDAKRAFKARDEAMKQEVLKRVGSGRQAIPFSVISEARIEMGKAKALCFREALHTIKTSISDIKKGKFVVFFWTHFTKDILIDQITSLGYTKNQIVVVSGKGMNNEDKTAAVTKFQEDDNVKFFLGQIETAGTAITLHSANVSIFVEFDWRPGIIQQAMDRTVRIGQTAENVYECFLIAENTIDANVFNILQEKTGVQKAILDDLPQVKTIERYNSEFMVEDSPDHKYSTDQRDLIQYLAEKIKEHYDEFPENLDHSEKVVLHRFIRECKSGYYEKWIPSENKYKKLGAKHFNFPEFEIDSVLPILWKHRTKCKKQSKVSQIEWPTWVTGIERGLFRPVKALDEAYSFFKYLKDRTKPAVFYFKDLDKAAKQNEKIREENERKAELAVAAGDIVIPGVSLAEEDEDKEY